VVASSFKLRVGELAILVPLVLCLIGLSAWPNLVSGHSHANPTELVAK